MRDIAPFTEGDGGTVFIDGFGDVIAPRGKDVI